MANVVAFTMKMQNKNNQRSWSDSFYKTFSAFDSAIIEPKLREIAQARATALVLSNTVVDITYWDVAVPSARTIIEVNLPGVIGDFGGANGAQDLAPAARMISLSSGVGKARQYLQRGICDADMVGGDFSPRPVAAPLYQSWITKIIAEQLQLRRSVFIEPAALLTVTQTVLTTVGAAPAWPKGSILSVRTRVAGNGPRISSRVLSRGVPAVNAVPVSWAEGNCEGGDVRRVQYAYDNIVVASPRVIGRTRKTGGPISRFRGKR